MMTAHASSPPTVRQVVARNVRVALKRERWSGRAAAHELGWHHANMARRLAGATDFNATELVELAELLGCDVAEFFTDTMRADVLESTRKSAALTESPERFTHHDEYDGSQMDYDILMHASGAFFDHELSVGYYPHR
jgi:hypothetical protein